MHNLNVGLKCSSNFLELTSKRDPVSYTTHLLRGNTGYPFLVSAKSCQRFLLRFFIKRTLLGVITSILNGVLKINAVTTTL